MWQLCCGWQLQMWGMQCRPISTRCTGCWESEWVRAGGCGGEQALVSWNRVNRLFCPSFTSDCWSERCVFVCGSKDRCTGTHDGDDEAGGEDDDALSISGLERVQDKTEQRQRRRRGERTCVARSVCSLSALFSLLSLTDCVCVCVGRAAGERGERGGVGGDRRRLRSSISSHSLLTKGNHDPASTLSPMCEHPHCTHTHQQQADMPVCLCGSTKHGSLRC